MKKDVQEENDKLYSLDTDNQRLVTKREEMKMNDELKDEIEKEVMEKVTSMLFGAMVGNVAVGGIVNTEVREKEQEINNKIIDNKYKETSMDETLVKMAGMWSGI